MGLKTFLDQRPLPQREFDILATLRQLEVKKIAHYVLGPRNISNIPQACELWQKITGLEAKSEMIIGITPDVYIKQAQSDTRAGVVPLVWTCAVYGQEKDLFFGHLNTSLFFVQQTMPLDHMQLATRKEMLAENREAIVGNMINRLVLPESWTKLTSHPSPKLLLQPLLENNDQAEWLAATSNGAAAEDCAGGKVDLCVCTEKARLDTGLEMLWDFGCPNMVFFGGLTEHGAKIVASAYAELERQRNDQHAKDMETMIVSG